MTEKVLLLFIDAYSSRYIKNELSPYVHRLSKKHYCAKMESSFGFLAVGSAIFAGVTPNTAGLLNQYVKMDSPNQYPQILQKLIRLGELIPSDRVWWHSRRLLFKLYGKKHLGVCVSLVPSHLLGYFELKPEKAFTDSNCLPVPTIFDVLREHGRNFVFLNEGLSLTGIVNDLIKLVKSDEIPDLTILKLGTLDLVGHSHGPTSAEMKEAIREVDLQINKIIEASRNATSDITVIVFSDHGMVPVDKYLNVERIVGDLPITLGKDYIMFLESTMARFWFFNSKAKEIIQKRFSEIEEGHLLTHQDLRQLQCDKLGEEHGELIFALKEGVAIYPDFFRRYKAPKGMHGYAFSSYDSPILLICPSDPSIKFEKRENIGLIDIMPTVLDLMGLPIPTTCEGESLVKRWKK